MAMEQLDKEEQLHDGSDDLIRTLSQFRDDEQHHHDTGLENEAELTPGYKLFTKGIETMCKVAVKIAERV